jgi:hypothetical protein
MARKVTDPSFRRKYSEDYYTVQGAETVLRSGTKEDIAAMRAEYTRMRDAAQKRLHRLEKAFPESKAVKSHPHGFKKLKDMDPRDLPKALAELNKFMRAKGSTVTGQKQIKEKTINNWNKQGIPLNDKNYDRVIKILEAARRLKIVYGSDKIYELAEATLRLTDQQFEKVLANLEQFLIHSGEVREAMTVYMAGEDIKDETTINMDSFVNAMGWQPITR